MAKFDEAELVDKARNGDVAAFESLVAHYEKKVFNMAYRWIGHAEDAYDISQEAFIRAYTRLGEFRGDASFQTWLLRIVQNACMDEFRRRKRQTIVSLDQPLPAADGEIARQIRDGVGEGPEEIAQQRELQRQVQTAITKLEEHFRMVLVLRDVLDLSYAEIAEILDENLGTIKSRLNRARNALRAQLERELLSSPVVYSARRRHGHEL